MEFEIKLEVQEYLDFANAIVPGSTEVISDLKTGEVWLELIRLIDEESVESDKIKKGRDLSTKDCKKNYKTLIKTLKKKDVEYWNILDNILDKLLEGDERSHYEVALWFKQYFDEFSEDELRHKIQGVMEHQKKEREDEGAHDAVLILRNDDDEMPTRDYRVEETEIEEKSAAETEATDTGLEEEVLIKPDEVSGVNAEVGMGFTSPGEGEDFTEVTEALQAEEFLGGVDEFAEEADTLEDGESIGMTRKLGIVMCGVIAVAIVGVSCYFSGKGGVYLAEKMNQRDVASQESSKPQCSAGFGSLLNAVKQGSKMLFCPLFCPKK